MTLVSTNVLKLLLVCRKKDTQLQYVCFIKKKGFVQQNAAAAPSHTTWQSVFVQTDGWLTQHLLYKENHLFVSSVRHFWKVYSWGESEAEKSRGVSNEFIMENECCLDRGGETDSQVIFTLLLQLVDSVMLKRRAVSEECGLSQRDTVKDRAVQLSHPPANSDSSKCAHTLH